MCGVVCFMVYRGAGGGGGGPSRPIILGMLELLCYARVIYMAPLDMCDKCREQFASSFLMSAASDFTAQNAQGLNKT